MEKPELFCEACGAEVREVDTYRHRCGHKALRPGRVGPDDRRAQLDRDRRALFPVDAMDREIDRRHHLARRLNDQEAAELAALAASPFSADRKAAAAGGYPW